MTTQTATSPLRVVLLGGEGIGPEVVESAARVIQHLIPSVTFSRPIHGEPAQKAHGTVIPPETKEACRAANAILFGATWKHCGDVLRFLRWGLDTYANVRPSQTRPGLRSPLKNDAPIDLVIVRENVEGEYPTREGDLAEFNTRWPGFRDIIDQTMPPAGAFALRIITEKGSRRISEYAARMAQKRRGRGRPGKVSIVTKQNVLKRSDGIFKQVAEQVLSDAGIPHDHFYVDDACRRLVAQPEAFDVILTPNLFGDIMSDVAAELVGGLGMAPSGCIGDGHAYFESVHGSAPDIAGKGIANPLATVLSVQMMLDHLGYTDEALAVQKAVARLLTDGNVLTPDLGGKARTSEVEAALIALL
jgi:isocitrate/isopropylmalate dehydrogenase